jgi:hypothetical protein
LKGWCDFLKRQRTNWCRGEKKKSESTPNKTELSYKCHLQRKKMSRRIKWYGRSMPMITVVNCMHHPKMIKLLTCTMYMLTTFFFFYYILTKMKLFLGLNDNNNKKKTNMKLLLSPIIKVIFFFMTATMELLQSHYAIYNKIKFL